MVNKIIQNEKERQELFFSVRTPSTTITCHKHSLSNFKEYLEEEILPRYQGDSDTSRTGNVFETGFRLRELKEDIEELTKMIEAYS